MSVKATKELTDDAFSLLEANEPPAFPTGLGSAAPPAES
jgi:hypothetical protein